MRMFDLIVRRCVSLLRPSFLKRSPPYKARAAKIQIDRLPMLHSSFFHLILRWTFVKFAFCRSLNIFCLRCPAENLSRSCLWIYFSVKKFTCALHRGRFVCKLWKCYDARPAFESKPKIFIFIFVHIQKKMCKPNVAHYNDLLFLRLSVIIRIYPPYDRSILIWKRCIFTTFIETTIVSVLCDSMQKVFCDSNCWFSILLDCQGPNVQTSSSQIRVGKTEKNVFAIAIFSSSENFIIAAVTICCVCAIRLQCTMVGRVHN